MSCQDVCLSMDYDGGNEFYNERWHKAAKPYRCCECLREIPKGEQYQRAVGKYEGRIFTEYTCAECAEIRQEFCCGSWLFGELWETVRDQMFRGWNEMTAIDCLARLTSQSAIDKMRAEYAEYMEDRDT